MDYMENRITFSIECRAADSAEPVRKRFQADSMLRLMTLDWPRNVREFEGDARVEY
jgi:DNA-binding NtrC family response regulator